MSLIYCPECGHEISAAAVACPNCGRPIQRTTPVVERKVVSNVVRDDSSFPKWAIIPIVAIGGLLLLFIFIMLSRGDETANDNLSVNVRTTTRPGDSRAGTTADGQTVTVPPGSSGGTITVPGTGSTSSQTVPGTQTGVTGASGDGKATVVIDAKVAPSSGAPQAVRNERFYLLDKDLESILSEADIEPIEGQTLTNSLGLSVLNPGRFADFNQKAMRAIKNHIKYAGTTDGSGRAQLGGIEPNSYYLFGITKVGRGFAVWSSPVSITSGQNVLNLSPVRLTEVQDSGG